MVTGSTMPKTNKGKKQKLSGKTTPLYDSEVVTSRRKARPRLKKHRRQIMTEFFLL